MPQIKLSKIPRVMFILSVNQLSNFVRPNPLKSHCRKRDIDEELEKANGHSGTFSGLCNTHTQNVRIWKEFTNYGPTPASLTDCVASQANVDTICTHQASYSDRSRSRTQFL